MVNDSSDAFQKSGLRWFSAVTGTDLSILRYLLYSPDFELDIMGMHVAIRFPVRWMRCLSSNAIE